MCELRGAAGLRRVRDAHGRQRLARAGADLARLLGGERYKVNLIPYNPTGATLDAIDWSAPADAIAHFKAVLDRARVPATVRLTRGRDIAAACGQLAAAQSA